MMRIFLLAPLMLPLVAMADTSCNDMDVPEGSAIYANCIAELQLTAADKRLNETYKKLQQNLLPDGPNNHPKKALIEAQRAWIKYRDASCEFVGEITGAASTWKSAKFVECQAEMTEKRTSELEKLDEEWVEG